jgi:hypothetical protein
MSTLARAIPPARHFIYPSDRATTEPTTDAHRGGGGARPAARAPHAQRCVWRRRWHRGGRPQAGPHAAPRPGRAQPGLPGPRHMHDTANSRIAHRALTIHVRVARELSTGHLAHGVRSRRTHHEGLHATINPSTETEPRAAARRHECAAASRCAATFGAAGGGQVVHERRRGAHTARQRGGRRRARAPCRGRRSRPHPGAAQRSPHPRRGPSCLSSCVHVWCRTICAPPLWRSPQRAGTNRGERIELVVSSPLRRAVEVRTAVSVPVIKNAASEVRR